MQRESKSRQFNLSRFLCALRMAESVVSLAVERISSLLIQEAVFLHEVKNEVQRLQAELKRIRCFLRDADRRQEQDERIRNLVAEIKDVAYVSEDVVDTFILELAQIQGGSCRFLKKLAQCFKKPHHLHKIGVEVQSIWRKLRDISDSLRTYDVKFVEEGDGTSARSEWQRRNRRTYAHAKEEYVIGLEDSEKAVIAQLMVVEEKLRVVSIVGMGGLGKTTLARRVYNSIISSNVKPHFDCHAWVFVSEQCAIRDVLLGIQMDVQDCSTVPENASEEALVKTLHKLLENRRYLIVLDDIWQVEAWESIKNAFPNGKMGSKVLFTTRNKDVAFRADPRSSPIEPPLVEDEDGWELLRRKVVDSYGGCPPEFEKLGQEMVKKCGGLPLALFVLGNLLATKKSLGEWKAVQLDMNAQLKKFEREQKYEGVFKTLALSYYDLPYYLKPCFLYLGHFPEDCAITKGKLTRLWIAEGFVDPQSTGLREETMEDEAESYFEQLVNRCVVQVWGSDSEGERGVKACRMHDLMREMCVSKAREENFLGILQPRNSYKTLNYMELTNSRRIAVHQNSGLHLIQVALKVRSLLFFLPQGRPCMYDVVGKCKNFRLFRVLDLQGIRFEDDTIGEEIGSLIHLKYLSLRGCYLRNVPDSIGDLQRLYTLDLRDNNFPPLPNEIWKLKLLRHLFVDHREKTVVARLDTLTHLHTVKNISAESVISDDGRFKLTNVRNLGISFKLERDVGVILQSPMEHLRSLKMEFTTAAGTAYNSLKPLCACHSLYKLQLSGVKLNQDRSLGHPLYFLPKNLGKLTLQYVYLEQDPMPVLEKLQTLRILNLQRNSYTGREMVCSANGFLQLKFLKLSGLIKLEEWIVEETAMPRLQTLCIDDLRSLTMVPEGLMYVTTLQELIATGVGSSLRSRLQAPQRGDGGEDHYKIAHIRSIHL